MVGDDGGLQVSASSTRYRRIARALDRYAASDAAGRLADHAALRFFSLLEHGEKMALARAVGRRIGEPPTYGAPPQVRIAWDLFARTLCRELVRFERSLVSGRGRVDKAFRIRHGGARAS